MTLFIVITLFLLLLVSLLLVPIIICIDTASDEYYFELQGLIKVNIEKHETEIFRIRLHVLFMTFYMYPLKKKKLNKQKKENKKLVTKPKTHITFNRFFKILKTFKIKRFFINIDTGNCILNAKLYPLFALLNYYTGNFYINFQGRNQLVLLVKNRPIDIIKSLINL